MIVDLQTHAGRLQKETKLLRDRWEATKQSWRDQAADDFERNFLAPLIPTLQLTLAAVNELKEAIAQAESDCGESRPE